jgi:hypothetical protein
LLTLPLPLLQLLLQPPLHKLLGSAADPAAVASAVL